ncbi:MAG: AAA family ATPase [Micavibrio aeruginosavorus]|uniref:AAA family ATPase n=1 Tax=Micavibrio aeruginosavorus TaxID=349221 RepID=A0A2W5A7B3_9BACT|nr:MAG: AAA family ATPase [Micavibrio aeruginosavorus]
MDDQQAKSLLETLNRIADALESGAGTGAARKPENWDAARAWLWQAASKTLKPVADTGALPAGMLVGIEQQKETLAENTARFAEGYAANNALLWGARGMGKSSLVKAIHAELAKTHPLHLIEIYREDIAALPLLLDLLRDERDKRFILFCDDLSFDEKDSGYKSLKAVLEGGIETRPQNVIFYATSNRRHLIPRQMIENEQSTAIHPGESVEEKVSLSDRFGLWLGFYPCSQDQYLEMVENYAKSYGLNADPAGAVEWFRTRGNRSGRVAWQYIQHLAGTQKKRIG